MVKKGSLLPVKNQEYHLKQDEPGDGNEKASGRADPMDPFYCFIEQRWKGKEVNCKTAPKDGPPDCGCIQTPWWGCRMSENRYG